MTTEAGAVPGDDARRELAWGAARSRAAAGGQRPLAWAAGHARREAVVHLMEPEPRLFGVTEQLPRVDNGSSF